MTLELNREIAAGISAAIIATVQGLGTKLTSTFTSVSNALNWGPRVDH